MTDVKMKNDTVGILAAFFCETLYGLSYIFTKQATQSATTFALLGWRFLLGAIVMTLFVLFKVIKVDYRGKSIKELLPVALFSPCIYYIAETIGIDHTTASESGIFLASIPIASLIASSLLLNEKPSKRQVTGIIVTLIGVLITVLSLGLSSSFSVIGYLFLLIAVISYALYSVFVSKVKTYTESEVTYMMLICGGLFFTILAIIEALSNGSFQSLISLPFNDRNFLIAILYQAIGCSILAFFLSNMAIARIGVNRTSSFIGVSTAVSILAGILILNEGFELYQVLGAIVIMVGVYIANINK